MRRLLVTGGSGYLGRKVVEMAREQWVVMSTYHRNSVVISGCASAPLDVLDPAEVMAVFASFRPDVVLHTAYSQADLRVISEGTRHVVRVCDEVGARLVHLSTDAVFDGARGWYRESDAPAPVHPYGKAKLQSELAVVDGASPETVVARSRSRLGASTWPTVRDALVVRTSLIWGVAPQDPPTARIVTALRDGAGLVLFTDEFRCPIWLDELVRALLELAATDICGLLHVAGPTRLSRYDFGVMLAKRLRLDTRGISAGLSAHSGLLRPRDCSLDTSLARSLLKTRISSPMELLDSG